jgi:glycosyltransferase involved in cell wall biosynthesis
MKILFIGFFVDAHDKSYFKGLSFAGNKLQRDFLEELSNRENIELDLVTILPHAMYPNGPLKIRKKSEISMNNSINLILKYINLPALKQITIIKNLYYEIKRLIKNNHYDSVITYNYFPVFSIPLTRLQSRYKFNLIPYLADLPIQYTKQQSILRKWYLKWEQRVSKRHLSQLSNCIVINLNASKEFCPKSYTLLIEGGVGVNARNKEPYREIKDHNFVYTGTLDAYSGILNLIIAIQELNNSGYNLYLTITGSGEHERLIHQLTKNDNFIEFKGIVTKEEHLSILKNAYCIVNPRMISHPVSKMTFPSKIHEYMLTKRPILSTKLSGISQVYFEKMYLIEGDDVDDFKKGISNVINSDELLIKS